MQRIYTKMFQSYLTNGKQLSFDKAQVMAIINLTPDSFYDGGKFTSLAYILKEVEVKIRAGATIIDIGAMSSKPNAIEITETEEKNRLQHTLKEIRTCFPDIFISVDTYRSQVADMVIDMGADIINDISGGDMDPNMIDVVAKHQVPYVMMHMKGTPQTMQDAPQYTDVVDEVFQFLKAKIEMCHSKGFNKLILDPGFGFGKSVVHNYQLLKKIAVFTNLGYPILAGLSRKTMINNVIHTKPESALNGTTVLNTIALQQGAKLLRVHDVAEASQAIDLLEFYNTI